VFHPPPLRLCLDDRADLWIQLKSDPPPEGFRQRAGAGNESERKDLKTEAYRSKGGEVKATIKREAMKKKITETIANLVSRGSWDRGVLRNNRNRKSVSHSNVWPATRATTIATAMIPNTRLIRPTGEDTSALSASMRSSKSSFNEPPSPIEKGGKHPCNPAPRARPGRSQLIRR
jgi:hypothetical protein